MITGDTAELTQFLTAMLGHMLGSGFRYRHMIKKGNEGM